MSVLVGRMVACLDLTQDPPIVCEVEERRRKEKEVKEEKEPKEKKERKLGECSVCHKVLRVYEEVEGSPHCYLCYRLRNATEEMCTFVREAYSHPCTFCGDTDSLKHFDHINMFEKRATILDLVDGPLEELKEELAKCQLLCVPCHTIVTRREHRMGFIKKKKSLTKAINSGKDMVMTRNALAAEYAVAMAPFYEKMRGRVPCVENKGEST